jgi:hypothetical protein
VLHGIGNASFMPWSFLLGFQARENIEATGFCIATAYHQHFIVMGTVLKQDSLAL